MYLSHFGSFMLGVCVGLVVSIITVFGLAVFLSNKRRKNKNG